ncbi:hypothetical protein ACIG0C_31715 [Kitasatospora aureofaciens]|uniref:Uncharacterized protein n=1 Tax=Kitasatospora aureofaciens TaxID=1894 RepID=A0A1E7N9A2_KITAU|nr:hypothetical protein [Kitasatospora aureofaciens]ARF81674.1 hypothetical protein B6264_24710 [Kitasatospora aureofaciens]OEV37053.1 hypothetical protein HS99_0004290 [Kitasatospora aureofaciens]GGV01152.1 hypothetical protein GCM10010502_64620 [Kitasatospora aureofaciens]
MSTAKNALDTPDPKWWHYPTAAALLIPLCWAALLVVIVGNGLFGYCALHGGCDHGHREARRHLALGLGYAQLLLAAASWPMPRIRRWTIARFVLCAFSALCGLSAGLAVVLA